MDAGNFRKALFKRGQEWVPGIALRSVIFVELAVVKSVIQLTPADFGTARGSWFFSESNDELTVFASSSTWQEVFERERPTIESQSTLQSAFLINNQKYIGVLENGGFIPENPGPSKDKRPGRTGEVLVVEGHSKQAPEGMVAVTLRKISDGG